LFKHDPVGIAVFVLYRGYYEFAAARFERLAGIPSARIYNAIKTEALTDKYR
jgi:hypothetical protein